MKGHFLWKWGTAPLPKPHQQIYLWYPEWLSLKMDPIRMILPKIMKMGTTIMVTNFKLLLVISRDKTWKKYYLLKNIFLISFRICQRRRRSSIWHGHLKKNPTKKKWILSLAQMMLKKPIKILCTTLIITTNKSQNDTKKIIQKKNSIKKCFDNLMTKKRYCNAWNDIKKKFYSPFFTCMFPKQKNV